MAQAGAGGLILLRVRAVHACLAAAGDTAVPGTHQHRKLRQPHAVLSSSGRARSARRSATQARTRSSPRCWRRLPQYKKRGR